MDNAPTHLESLNRRTERADEAIHNKACEDDDVRLLLSMTGVDVYLALLIKFEITAKTVSQVIGDLSSELVCHLQSKKLALLSPLRAMDISRTTDLGWGVA